MAYVGFEYPYGDPVRYGLGSGAGQDADRARLESVYRRRGSGPDANRPQRRDPGDRYVLRAVLLGLVLGIAVGLIAAFIFDFSRYFGIVVGAAAGVLVGLAIGDLLKKGHERKRRRGAKQ